MQENVVQCRPGTELTRITVALLGIAPDSRIMLLLWVARQIGKIALKFRLFLARFFGRPETVKI
jgi:hypothetical protein